MEKTDLLSLNVFWLSKDLELYENQADFHSSIIFTFARIITFVMGIIVHRAVYKVLKILSGRSINQMIYPYMVSKYKKCWLRQFFILRFTVCLRAQIMKIINFEFGHFFEKQLNIFLSYRAICANGQFFISCFCLFCFFYQ